MQSHSLELRQKNNECFGNFDCFFWFQLNKKANDFCSSPGKMRDGQFEHYCKVWWFFVYLEILLETIELMVFQKYFLGGRSVTELWFLTPNFLPLPVNAAHPHEALEFDVEGFNKELQSQVQGAKYGMDVWNSTNDGESGEDWSKYKMHSSEETEVDKLHIFD